jgi:solute carrier family 6 GABA transporter-like protein 6/8/11/12/13
MKRVRYGKDYVFPVWAEIVGWFIALLSIIAIPIGAIHAIYKADGNTIIQVNHFSSQNFDSLQYSVLIL